MTADELKTSRAALGMKAADLGRALELEGRDPGRYVRLWETNAHPVPGPVAVAVRYMLQDKARQTLQEAVEEARAILTPANPPAPVLNALEALDVAARPKTRRRG